MNPTKAGFEPNDLIEVVDLDYYNEDENICLDAKEVWIDFLDWHIVISVRDGQGSDAPEEITIIAKMGGDKTEDFFVYKNDNNKKKIPIAPTGMNLFQIMDLLKTNYQKKVREKQNEKV
jgi:hypothetical protein